MNMKVAYRPDLLKRRLDDFFTSCDERKAAREMIVSLAQDSHAWIFGGMIRDIGLFGRKGFRSDIDVVLDVERHQLTARLEQLSIQHRRVNKLGGIRFRYQNIDFDIWCLADTWAFKQKIIPFEDAHSLLKTTLMTWDAILYDVQRRQVISPENYLDDLIEKRLELVLEHTPNEIGSLVKILRTIYGKQVDKIGPKLCQFLLETLGNYQGDTLIRYELSHYQTPVINGLKLAKLHAALAHNQLDGDLTLHLRQQPHQLLLHFAQV